MKKLIFLLFLVTPVYASQLYDFADPKLNNELSNNYKEHSYPIWTYARGSSMTINSANISNMTASSATITSLTVSSCSGCSSGIPESITVSTLTVTSSATLMGRVDGSDACPGCIGAYISSTSIQNIGVGTSGQWKDAATLFVPAGDWDLTGLIDITRNGATVTATVMAITTTPGNSATGAVQGTTRLDFIPPSNQSESGATIANLRASLTSGTSYYLKIIALYTVATPLYNANLSGRRTR